MSLCRTGPDCDVYVFEPVNAPGHLECCGCLLRSADQGAVVLGRETMLAHLERHREWSHLVPDRVFDAVREWEPA